MQIENETFMCCKIKSIQFSSDSKLSSMGERAFCLSSIENVIVPRNVQLINDQAFDLRKLVTVEIIGSVVNICKNNFTSDKIFLVSLPNAQQISIFNNLFRKASNEFSLFVKCDVKINYIFN